MTHRPAGQGPGVQRLQAYYRVSSAGNGKPRPPWFSKRLALQSFLAACAAAGPGVDVVFVADGGVPAELADLVRAGGPVVPVRGGDAPRSFRALLEVADAEDDALVWFAEDDYLYLPSALQQLRAAAAALPEVEYVGLYTPDNAAWHADHRSQPGRRGPAQRWDVRGTAWQRAWDSTTTFGLRGSALRRDRRLLALCSRTGGPWDNTTVTTVQGVPSYAWPHLYGDLYLRPTRASAQRVVGRPLLRGLANLAALGARATWVAPVRSLATHAEAAHLAPGTDWEQVAAQVPRP
ncbi:MAG: hypothetical protein JWO60_3010 [Frankiales bacterium]|nr:hypothetical protein [Frankiales bacterium]